MSVTAEQFVNAWLESVTYKDVAAKTGLSVTHVRVRGSQLRKKGVALPELKRATSGPKRTNIAALNALIAAKAAR